MPSEDRYPLFGKLAVKYRTITETQLKKALAIQAGRPGPTDLGEILINEKMATPKQVNLLNSIRELLEQREADESFARIAVYMGFTTQEAVDSAFAEQTRQFREEKLGRLISDILVEAGALTPGQRTEVLKEQKRVSPLEDRDTAEVGEVDLPPVDREFLATRKESEKFGTIAVKKRFVTRPQVDLALSTQLDEYKRSRKSRMLGDILVENGAITQEQKEIVLAAQQSAPGGLPSPDKQPPEKTTLQKPHAADTHRQDPEKSVSIIVSGDRMKAHLHISGRAAPPPAPALIRKLLLKKGIVSGIMDDALIAGGLELMDQGGKSFLVAEGALPLAPKEGSLTFHFDNARDGKIGDTAPIRKGTLLALKTGAADGKPGKDIFGKKIPVPPVTLRNIRCGSGTAATKDGLKIFAKIDGHPFMSVDGRVFVFANLRIAGDTRNGDRFLDFKLNIHAGGTIGHNCVIKGGEISSSEIRGADIDAMGNIRASVGITGAIIRTQGSVHAGYIRNSVIEALGDVVVDNEIMDSKVHAGGICRVARSRVIASHISAGKGISILTAGTPVSDPCSLKAGSDDHIHALFKRLDNRMGLVAEEICPLALELETLEGELKAVNSRISHLFTHCNRLAKAIKTTSAKLEGIPEGKPSPGGTELLKELQVKSAESRTALQRVSDEKKRIGKKHWAVSGNISELENEIRELCLIKKGFLPELGKERGIPKITVTGPVSSGTTLSGRNSSITLSDDCPNLQAVEERIEGSDPPAWEMKIVTRDNKYL